MGDGVEPLPFLLEGGKDSVPAKTQQPLTRPAGGIYFLIMVYKNGEKK